MTRVRFQKNFSLRVIFTILENKVYKQIKQTWFRCKFLYIFYSQSVSSLTEQVFINHFKNISDSSWIADWTIHTAQNKRHFLLFLFVGALLHDQLCSILALAR